MMQVDDTLHADPKFERRYEILAELGSGSFGQVFKARQLSTGQLVAVKVLRLTSAGNPGDAQQRIERFRRETRVGAELSHPNIVRLIDSGETGDGQLYAAFEFIPGVTLKDVLATEERLSMAEAVHLMAQVLDALSCAHASGIVHRDLKPENVMITKTGARRNALVLDFGLGGFARDAEAETLPRITATQELLGTPCYAAPEQLRGEPPTIRSDLYSWGLMFLECLTGELPVRGASAQEVIMKQLGPDPVAIPPWLRVHPLGRVLEMVTAKRADVRDVSAERLLQILTPIGTGNLSVADQVGSGYGAERERRQLTLVCCRLTISADNGRQADVEEIDQLLQAQHTLLREQAAHAGGSVATSLADRVFLVFGYPQALEDDARRAVRLARDLVRNSASLALNGDLRVDIRVGVHTGLVIVPDLRHGATPRMHELTGVTPQVVSQLVEQADPGAVLVSFDTYHLIRNEFQSEPAGECVIAELSRALPVFRLGPPHRDTAATESAALTYETPFVGRNAQFQQLLDGWNRARTGCGSVLVITGEAGVGKSRLLRELRRHVDLSRWIEWRCAPENQTAPLRPVIDALSAMKQSVESLLTALGLDLKAHLPVLSALLSLPPDDRYPPLQLSAERQKELTLQVLVEILLRMSAQEPMVLALENLHWGDPTTLELAALLIQELRAARYMDSEAGPRLYVVLTTRPDCIPSWSPEDVSFLPLQRLPRDEAENMIRAGLGSKRDLPAALLAQIAERTEGIPLFIEEVTRVVLASARAHPDTPASSAALRSLDIPTSLRGLLTARLDGVAPAARETAHLAAVLGREFRMELLEAVSPKDPGFLRQDIAELVRAGLLFRRRSADDQTYVFRHALLRDAAYEALTRSTRQTLHRRVATALQQKFPDIGQRRPEILALHYEEGADVGAALDHWARAWNESYRRAAYAEAQTQIEHALALTETLGPSADHLRRQMDLLVALGTSQISTRGWAVPEVDQTFARAWQICTQLGGDPPMMVLYGIWGVRITRSDRAGIEALLPQVRALADHATDPLLAIMGHGSLGTFSYWTGDFRAAHHHFEHALQHYGAENQRLAYDAGLYNLAFEFATLWMLGSAERAQKLRAEAFEVAERRRDPYSLALVLGFGAMLANDCGEVDAARAWSEQLMTLSNEQRLFAWWAPGAVNYGRALLDEGRVDGAVRSIREGLDRYRLVGVMCAYAYYLPYLATAYLKADRLTEGLAVIEEGLTLTQTLLARLQESELLRIRGDLRLRQGDSAGAEADYRRALAVAEADGARAYELRAASQLAILLANTGRRTEGLEGLQSVYDRFTEGFGTRDLRNAAALLKTL